MGVERLKAADFEDLTDFINLVFSQTLFKVDFKKDLGYLYAKDDEHMRRQYAYRDEAGKIRSAVGVMPYTYKVGNEEFSAKTITNVATHLDCSGKGYMSSVLKKAISDMEEDGTDFAILHGQKERYLSFGFNTAGVGESAVYKAFNIPDRVRMGEVFDYSFEPVSEKDAVKCEELFEKEPQHFVRPEGEFLRCLSLWNGRTFAVLDKNGDFSGYLNCMTHFGSPVIREIFLKDPAEAAKIIYSFMKEKGFDSVKVHFSPFNEKLSRTIYETAEDTALTHLNRIKFFRPKRLLEACLDLKNEFCPLSEGRLVVKSAFGNLLIENDGKFHVQDTDKEPDFVVEGRETNAFFFGPHPNLCGLADRSTELSVKIPACTWFPAPLYIHNSELY